MSMGGHARASFMARISTLIGEGIVRNDPHVHAALSHATQQGLSVEEALALCLRAQTEAKNGAVAYALDLVKSQPLVVVAPHDRRLSELVGDLKRITSEVTEHLNRVASKAERIASQPAEHLNSNN